MSEGNWTWTRDKIMASKIRPVSTPLSSPPTLLTTILCCLHFITLKYGVLAEVQVDCYHCVWQKSGESGAEDFCRPENFRGEKVSVGPCLQGCNTIIMYENDPDGPVTTAELREPLNVTDAGAKPPMSFFTRGCPKGDNTRKKTGCEEKSYRRVFREECFCTGALCNGGAKAANIVIHGMQQWSWSLVVGLVVLAFLAHNTYST